MQGGMKKSRFSTNRFISEMIQDRAIVTVSQGGDAIEACTYLLTFYSPEACLLSCYRVSAHWWAILI